ncbi:calponin-like domain protein (macronuclear) [Tetrahymena thermophila SB210]|uniref:Calponin-like domain protein n=1 Tax=Tetrahymena thermophila (strain SB210) TaxID=312017 RepID=I7LX87_TETTS|nr:calponin-like domain protein [Tetrahymena thermophila SB210]EAS03961.2 calponin-like domain protein [Tetrahymena thermophila SB210]|eukprot:XP_001024206.2 calponin-like domain protein [Tetrahymena thermophila SB210]
MDNNNQLYHSIVAWINKLQAHEIHKEKLIDSILDLKDGVILAKLFNLCVPNNYKIDESQMYTEDVDNWAFTLKNLNIIYDSISSYNTEVNQKSTPEIEFLSIFNEDNKVAMLQLIEEVFGIVLQSEMKNEFITAIIDLDEEDQEKLSHFLKKLLKVNSNDKIRLDTDQSLEDHHHFSLNESGLKQQQSKDSKGYTQDKELLKKIDEIELELGKEKKKFETLKLDYDQLNLKILSFQEQIEKKDQLIDKLIKQRDEFLNSTGYQSFEDAQQEIKNKQNKISDLNKIIDELKNDHQDAIKNLKDEINLHEKKLEKYKNYEKMVETVKTLNEENKYLEKRVQECEKIVEDMKKRNTELSQKVQDKEEMMKKKYEQKQLVQKNIDLETELGSKTAECQQLQQDIYELQQLNSRQEEQIKTLNKKVQELQMKSSEKKRAMTPTKRNLSSDFNDMVNKLEMHEYYRKQSRHQTDINLPKIQTNFSQIDEEEHSQKKEQAEQQEGHEFQTPNPNQDGEKNELNTNEKEEQYRDMEENYELLQLENEKLRSQIKKMQQDIAKKSSVSDQYKQIYQLQEEKAKLESEVAILEKKCSQQQQDGDDDKSKIIKNLQDTIKSLKERVGFLQEENKELKEHSQQSEQADKLKLEMQKLKKQIDFFKLESEDKRKQLEEEIKLLVGVINEIRMKTFDLSNSGNKSQLISESLISNSQATQNSLQNQEINRQISNNSVRMPSQK